MRIVLVNSPWARIDSPSLALGILKRCTNNWDPSVSVDVVDANLDYVDWIVGRSGFSADDYRYYSYTSYFEGFGDWIFSSALYDDPSWRSEEFEGGYAGIVDPRQLKLAVLQHALAPAFINTLASEIVDLAPDVVGFTTTFQQNTAALATARQLKRLRPQLVTVFGGANCDGPQGVALHRSFPFVDFVVRGEGEMAFPRLLSAVRDGSGFEAVTGLCWRSEGGESVTNAMSVAPLPAPDIAEPDYDGFYDRLRTSVACRWNDPKLTIESARGCWWGEKHHCTFCGLNGSFMKFRSKSPARFYDEIMRLVERYSILDLVVVDNILDMSYLSSLMPRLVETGLDLRFHYEIKSNMQRHQLEMLAQAGVIHVQPGIESLSSRVLKLMDKGVTGCQNVRMLRDAHSVGLTVDWNYLYGFPGETSDDYDGIIAQMPALHHLPPAVEDGARIAVERFSPYFDKPELGFSKVSPDRQYELIYDLPREVLFDLAYIFRAPNCGIDRPTGERLGAALREWDAAHVASRLVFWELDGELLLLNQRPGFSWSTWRLTDPVHIAMFHLLDQPRTPQALERHLRADFPDVDLELVSRVLEQWLDMGLVFTDAGQFVQLATRPANQHLMHATIQGAEAAHWSAVLDRQPA